MDGIKHYRRAEAILADAFNDAVYTEPAEAVAEAQVHATLALAAATVLAARPSNMVDDHEYESWRRATASGI